MKMFNKILGCSTAVATVLAFGASTTQAQNLLVNGGFEDAGGFTPNAGFGPASVNQGWATYGATGQSDMTSSPDSPLSGTFSLIEANAAGNNWNPAGAYQLVSPAGGVIAGNTYTFTAYVLSDTGITTDGPGMELGFRGAWNGTAFPTVGTDVNNYWLGQTPGPGGANGPYTTTHTWTQETISEVAPAGATGIIVYLQAIDYNQAATENIYWDSASLVTPAPEPSTLALAGLGGGALLSLIRRRKS
jgi:hypothetical protein